MSNIRKTYLSISISFKAKEEEAEKYYEQLAQRLGWLLGDALNDEKNWIKEFKVQASETEISDKDYV